MLGTYLGKTLPTHPPTIDNQYVTADIGTRSTGEVHGRAFKVLWASPLWFSFSLAILVIIPILVLLH